MEIRLLRYFLTVVREGNISRAADILHITQPTLSRQMMQLEEAAGTQLFVRGRHLELTEAGLLLRHRAEEVVLIMEKIERELAASEELSGCISIGCGGQNAVKGVLDALDDFCSLHPQVSYEIYTNNADNIKECLDSGILDFGILLEPIDISQYEYIRLAEKDTWGVWMNSDSPLAAKDSIAITDILSIPIITTSRLSLSKEIRHWFGKDFDRLDIKATYNVITNVAALVAGGRGYALTIDGAVPLYDKEHLSFRPLTPQLTMSSVLAWKKVRPGHGLAGRFLEYYTAGTEKSTE